MPLARQVTCFPGWRTCRSGEHRFPAGQTRHRQRSAAMEHEKLELLFRQVETAKKEWEMTMDCLTDMIILADSEANILRCNRAVINFAGKTYTEILGTKWPRLFSDHGLHSADFMVSAQELYHSGSGRWYFLRIYSLCSTERNPATRHVIIAHDYSDIKQIARALEQKNRELEQANAELKAAQSQLLQQEKMASIGLLAAGVAHEINNPIGFIISNLGSLGKYLDRLTDFIDFQGGLLASLANEEISARQAAERQRLKLDFIKEDVGDLIAESLEGAARVKKIVQDLKGFSRVDQADFKETDLHECLDSTLNIAWNELKYKARVIKEYGEVSPIACYPQQLNQVFLNLLVNAAQAIADKGEITIRTWEENNRAWIAIADTGSGIAPEHLPKIFEPFFTTKEVGKGTGLGLSMVFDIITKNHHGEISVQSEPGKGTTFTISLPFVRREKVRSEE
jgi:two-component system NtrC family sensor kinase